MANSTRWVVGDVAVSPSLVAIYRHFGDAGVGVIGAHRGAAAALDFADL